MKTILKKTSAIFLVLALVLCPVLAGARSAFAMELGEKPVPVNKLDTKAESNTITVTYYVDGTVWKTQVFAVGEDQYLYSEYPTKSGQVFLYWVTDTEMVAAVYNPGSNVHLEQDIGLIAYFAEEAADSEGIRAVKNGKSEYTVVYDGTFQHVSFDAAQDGNTYEQDRMNGYEVDGIMRRFFKFDEWDLLVSGGDWYIEITGLGARGQHVGRYTTTPVSGAEWVQTWPIPVFTQREGKYGQIAPGTLIIEERPLTVRTADVDVRFGDVIPTDDNEIMNVVEGENILFAEQTADTVGKGQVNTYVLEAGDNTLLTDYRVDEEILGTLDVYYEIAYDLNGGEGEIEAGKAYESAAVLSETVPSLKGSTFKGWSTVKAGSPEYQPGDEIELEGNVTLYAVWDTPSPDTSDSNLMLIIAMTVAMSMLIATAVIPGRKQN